MIFKEIDSKEHEINVLKQLLVKSNSYNALKIQNNKNLVFISTKLEYRQP